MHSMVTYLWHVRIKTLVKKTLSIFGRTYIAIFGINEGITQNYHRRDSLSILNKIKFFALRETLSDEYYTANFDRRRQIASMFYGQEESVRWAKNYNDNVEFDYQTLFSEEKLSLTWVEKMLSTKNYSVHELGTSSGRQIAHFAKKFPQSKFVGSDLFDELISYLKNYYNLPNLNFKKVDAGLLDDVSKIKEDILVAAGVLCLLNEEEILTLFSNVKSQHIIIGEPIFGHGSVLSSTPVGGFQSAHPYEMFLKNTGWVIVRKKLTNRPSSVPSRPNYWINIRAKRTSKGNSLGVAT